MRGGEQLELQQRLDMLAKTLPDKMAQAALVHMVGNAAGLNMAVDPVTNAPRSLSAATELTARFLEEQVTVMKKAGIYAYEEKDPAYYRMLEGIMQKAANYKDSFGSDEPDAKNASKTR